MDVPLQDRPSVDEAVALYEQMQTAVRDAVAAVDPTVSWAPRRDGSAAGCGGEDSGQGGSTVTLPRWGSEGGIGDEVWPDVVRAVEEVVAATASAV